MDRTTPWIATVLCALSVVAGAADDQAAQQQRALIAQLGDRFAHGTPYQRSEAAQSLQREGKSAAGAAEVVAATTVAAIDARDWRLAGLGVETLAVIDQRALAGCVPGLQHALAGGIRDVRREAARVSAALGPAGAPLAATLATLVTDRDCGVDALHALAAIGTASEVVVPTLRKAAQDADVAVALAGIEALELLGPRVKETVPTLCGLLARDDLRTRALIALASFGHAAADAVPQVLEAEARVGGDRSLFVRVLQQIETKDIPPIGKEAAVRCREGSRIDFDVAIDDPDDPAEALHPDLDQATSHGRMSARGGLGLTYEVAWGFVGDETFAWKPSDNRLQGAASRIVVTVEPDTAPPAPTSFLMLPGPHQWLRVAFDKPLDQASAEVPANWTLDRDTRVLAAKLLVDRRTVDLRTSGLIVGVPYQLGVHGVASAAATPVVAAIDGHAFVVRQYIDGLAGRFFRGPALAGDPTGSGIATTIDFPAGPQPGQEDYSARWTGFIDPPATETVTFHAVSDDGVRLWIGGKLIIDGWKPQSPTAYDGSIALEAHVLAELKLEYFQGGGPACLTLSWSSPTIAQQIVPTTALKTPPPVAP